MLANLKLKARGLKAETFALYYAARHPSTPWYAKVLAALVVAYAFSPIDLVPDFVPVLGYLDDFILIPLGIALALRLLPSDILTQCRAQAAARLGRPKPINLLMGTLIILLWFAAAMWLTWAGYRHFFPLPHTLD